MDGHSRDFTGQRINRYFLFSSIGAGAGGTVYKAVDMCAPLSPMLAIKCVRESRRPIDRRMQIAEMANQRAVARCANVLRLYGTFESHEHFFFVMPLYEADMHKAIWKRRAYWRNDTLIKEVFMKVLQGVLACHKQGIYHRDLKPENILCDENGTNVQIGDFGFSTRHRVCRDGVCGTTAYIAPECWNAREDGYYADCADVWALGVILFNMVTCCFPWDETHPRNKYFREFLTDGNYLLRNYPISNTLNILLSRMWDPNPLTRATLPDIQHAMRFVGSFYRYDPPPPIQVERPLPERAAPINFQHTYMGTMEEPNRLDSLDRVLTNVLQDGTFNFCLVL